MSNLKLDQVRFSKVQSYLQDIVDTNNCLFIGGIVRYIYGIDTDFRDIDIIVPDDFDFSKLPSDQTVNMYGGHKFVIQDKEIDLWKLKDHIIPCKAFKDVQETWLIASDALYYHHGSNTLYEKYYRPYPVINFNRDIKDCEKTYINYKLEKIFKER